MRSIASALIAAMVCVLVPAAGVRGEDVDRRLTGGVVTYVTVKGDTLRSISARVGVDAATLAVESNVGSAGVDPRGGAPGRP